MIDLPPELSSLELPYYKPAMQPKEPLKLPWTNDDEFNRWVENPIWMRKAFTADKDHLNSVLMSKPIGDLLAAAYVKSIHNSVHKVGLSFLGSFTGPHRCQAAGDKVLMADGSWKNIEDVKFGDEVLSPQLDGSVISSKVTATSSHFAEEVYDVMEAKLSNKKLYTCSAEHPIPLIGEFRGRINGIRQKKKRVYKEFTAQHVSKLKSAEQSRLVTFSSPQVDFNKPDSDVNPYCLGLWIGDGHCSTTIRNSTTSHGFGMTTDDPEIIEAFKQGYPGEVNSIYKKKGTTAVTIRITTKPHGKFLSELKRLHLIGTDSGTKFIPKECMTSSVLYRTKLLAGLIDTDGTMPKHICCIEITTKSEQLSKDILDLVHSLGGNGRITKIKKGIKSIGFVGEYYCIRFAFKENKPLANEIQVKRKKERLLGYITRYEGTNRNHTNYDPRHISIKCIRTIPQAVYGFTLDSPSSLYITNDWLVTHNTGKSVSACLFGHYLDHSFWPNFEHRVIQSPYQFMTCMENIIKDEVIGASIVVDEAGTTFSAGDWYEKWMKTIQKFLQVCGLLKPIILFVAPNREFIVSGMRKLIVAEHHMKKYDKQFSRMSCYNVKYNFMKKGDPYFFRRPVIRIGGQTITLKHINVFEPPAWFVDRYKNLTESDKKSRLTAWTAEVQKIISNQEDEGEPDYDALIEEIWQKKEIYFGRLSRDGTQKMDQTQLEIHYKLKPKHAKYIVDRIERRLAENKAQQEDMRVLKAQRDEAAMQIEKEKRMKMLKRLPAEDLAQAGTEERKEQKEKMTEGLEEILSDLKD